MKVSIVNDVINILHDDIRAGWEWKLLVRSDAHHDSPYADHKLEKEHLDEAKRDNAGIIDVGDLCDAMQGKSDKRSALNDLRPELKVTNYYGAVVDYNAEFYKPYAKNFIMIGKGNHETSVLDKNNTDLTSNLVYKLNQETGSNIIGAGISGYIRLQFQGSGGSDRVSKILRYAHGSGGEAPVTHGVIQTNRQAAWLNNVDIICNGHNHQEYVLSMPTQGINRKGSIENKNMWFLRTPGYKCETGSGGYADIKMMAPTPKGAIWVHFRYLNKEIQMTAYSTFR
jgi:hypothetical protein